MEKVILKFLKVWTPLTSQCNNRAKRKKPRWPQITSDFDITNHSKSPKTAVSLLNDNSGITWYSGKMGCDSSGKAEPCSAFPLNFPAIHRTRLILRNWATEVEAETGLHWMVAEGTKEVVLENKQPIRWRKIIFIRCFNLFCITP